MFPEEDLRELTSRLIEIGYTSEELRRLVAGDFLIRNLSELRRGRSGQSLFWLEVDHRLSLKQMLIIADLDWVDEKINEEFFSFSKSFYGEQGVELIHFNREIATTEVEMEIKHRGCRSATLPEFLSFISIYRNIQKDFPVVTLGARASINGQTQVPVLLWGQAGRVVGLTNIDKIWSDNIHFLTCKL
ncbi:MAG: hypothetical protein ACOCU8_03030 [Patescibacteria group bacterium]